MRNHSEKLKDMAESVLPSTAAARTRLARRAIHHRERSAARQAIALFLADPDRGGDGLRGRPSRGYRRDIDQLVWDRRARDKVGPICRWATRRVAVNPALADLDAAEQVDHFRRLLPDNLIGRHAVSHIDSALRWEQRRRARGSGPVVDGRLVELRDQLRTAVENGFHKELNRGLKRAAAGTDGPVRLLLGFHDVNDFAEHARWDTRVSSVIAEIAGRSL